MSLGHEWWSVRDPVPTAQPQQRDYRFCAPARGRAGTFDKATMRRLGQGQVQSATPPVASGSQSSGPSGFLRVGFSCTYETPLALSAKLFAAELLLWIMSCASASICIDASVPSVACGTWCTVGLRAGSRLTRSCAPPAASRNLVIWYSTIDGFGCPLPFTAWQALQVQSTDRSFFIHPKLSSERGSHGVRIPVGSSPPLHGHRLSEPTNASRRAV